MRRLVRDFIFKIRFIVCREYSLTLYVRVSISVQFTSCLTGLDSDKQVNLLKISTQKSC